MKVIQVHTEEIPIADRTRILEKEYVQTVIYHTDANYYLCMKCISSMHVPTADELEQAYNNGKKVSVKRAVELFGSAISDKMDWTDTDD